MLHGDKVDGIVRGRGDVAVLNVQVIALVGLDRLLGRRAGLYVAHALNGAVVADGIASSKRHE